MRGIGGSLLIYGREGREVEIFDAVEGGISTSRRSDLVFSGEGIFDEGVRGAGVGIEDRLAGSAVFLFLSEARFFEVVAE